MNPDLGLAPYADASQVVAAAVRAFLPPERQTVAQYALKHRVLANAGGGVSGRFSFRLAPYMREPMELLTSRAVGCVAIAGPGQSAKTTAAENWLLWAVGAEPANMLWYMQTDEAVEAYVKTTINTMLDVHPELRDALGQRSIDDSLHFKRFKGMSVEFLSATPSNLISKKAPRIIADEIDAYDQSIGDVKVQLDVRRSTFGTASKLLLMSHPDLARGINPRTDWTAGIMAVYADSTQCLWYWPCPHCGAWSTPAPTGTRVMTIEYPPDGTLAEIEREARLLCPVHGCLIDDRARFVMNGAGRWVGLGEEILEDGQVIGERIPNSVAGYWIQGAMSLLNTGGIGALARARVKAEREREVSGDDVSLREVMVKRWGVPYAPPRGAGTIDAAVLVERAETALQLGFVPYGGRFLTCSVDVQLNRFEYLVRAWGVGGESWIVDYGAMAAEPATKVSDWDRLLTDVLLKAYPLADLSGRVMHIRARGYDMQGAPGVSAQAYSAWLRWRRRRMLIGGIKSLAVVHYGKISGRDAYSIMPLRGASTLHAPRLMVSYPDTSRQANQFAARGQVPVATFNPNEFKNDLAGQLMHAEPGPLYVHFPGALKSPAPPHLFFEQLASETRRPDGRWLKYNNNARNEAIDLLVMSHVIAHLHGLPRLDWERPPNWAAPWDENSLVMSPGAEQPQPPSARTASATPLASPAVRESGSDSAMHRLSDRRRAVIEKLAGGR